MSRRPPSFAAHWPTPTSCRLPLTWSPIRPPLAWWIAPNNFRGPAHRCDLELQQDTRLVDLSFWEAEYTRERWGHVLDSSVAEDAFGRRLQDAGRRGRPR